MRESVELRLCFELSSVVGHTDAPGDPDISVRWASKPLRPLTLSSLSHFEVGWFHFGFLIYTMGLISPTSVHLL